jgi:hypothetical protein
MRNAALTDRTNSAASVVTFSCSFDRLRYEAFNELRERVFSEELGWPRGRSLANSSRDAHGLDLFRGRRMFSTRPGETMLIGEVHKPLAQLDNSRGSRYEISTALESGVSTSVPRRGSRPRWRVKLLLKIIESMLTRYSA